VKNRVREQRLHATLSQAELGDALGVSRQTINSIETGRYVPVPGRSPSRSPGSSESTVRGHVRTGRRGAHTMTDTIPARAPGCGGPPCCCSAAIAVAVATWAKWRVRWADRGLVI
jgi:hypothetical protein